MSSHSGSDSDSDEAPEAVSLSTSRRTAKQQVQASTSAAAAARKKDKDTRRDRAEKARKIAASGASEGGGAGKGKGKKRAAAASISDDGSSSEQEDEPTLPKQLKSALKKPTHLDPAFFDLAAASFASSSSTSSSTGAGAPTKKKARHSRAAKRLKVSEEGPRAGDAVELGDGRTVQHLLPVVGVANGGAPVVQPTPSGRTDPGQAVSYIPSRLFSKSRALGVLAASQPAKRARTSSSSFESINSNSKKSKGGMSQASRILLGLESVDEEKEERKKAREEKGRKRKLLLGAKGQRKRGTVVKGRVDVRDFAR